MRAVSLREFGPPEELVAVEVPDPDIGAGQVLIDVEFANVTFVDTQLRGAADGRTAALLIRSSELVPGESVLVEAAGGGVGTLLVQLAVNAGGRVVGAAGEDSKLRLAHELGAEITVNYREETWVEELRGALGDELDLAFDGVGGGVGHDAFELVRDGGRFFSYGMASGSFAPVADDEAARRGVALLHLGRPSPEESVELTRDVLEQAAAGRLHPVVGQMVSLEEAARAHAAIEARATVGKTLLVVRGTGEVR